MSEITHFFIAFGLSFIGSLPPGLINLTVAMTAIRRNLKAALLVGAGACIVEWLQSFIAVKFSSILIANQQLGTIFQIVALVIFTALAVYYLFFASTSTPEAKIQESKKLTHFFKGMAVSSANVMVFPYWIFYGTYLGSKGWLESSNYYIAIFSTGVAAGAFAVFVIFAFLARLIVTRVSDITVIANRTVGFIFLLLALLQVYDIFF